MFVIEHMNTEGLAMLIKHTPDAYEKLRILGGMATDDILTQPETRAGRGGPYPAPNKNPTHGVYRASMPNGKYINLMRVMFTDFCKMDCHYCPNSHWVPRKRYAFKVDELARTFAELARRQTVSGLFLSSGIAGDGSKTTERLVKVVDAVRNKYGFKGYIHMKVMPGAEYEYVEAAYRLGTRLSVNMETPTVEHMQKLSKMKDLKRDILDPMEWVHNLTEGHTNGPVGQATQLVVGAADETDRDIFGRMDQLYTEWKLKRIYYAPFRPVRYTPPRRASNLHPWPAATGSTRWTGSSASIASQTTNSTSPSRTTASCPSTRIRRPPSRSRIWTPSPWTSTTLTKTDFCVFQASVPSLRNV